MFTLVKKSSSGSTKWVDTIYFEIKTPKSYASYILLRHYYSELDVDNINSIANKMRMIGFSRDYLTQIKKQNGCLCCSYCNKPNLIIELQDMKVPLFKKATIDHVIPISKGGALFNYDNIVVACGTCNNKKGDKTVEEFLKNNKHAKNHKVI